VEELPPPPPESGLNERKLLRFKTLKNVYNKIITESGGVQEVAAPPLRPTAEE
jgi:hypothetical protein